MEGGSSRTDALCSAALLDSRLERYDRALIDDPEMQSAMRRSGFLVVPDVVDPSVVAELRSLADEFLRRLEEPWGDLFLTVGRVRDPELRSEITQRAGDLVLPAIAPLFVVDAALYGTALQIKPPSPTSELNPHQDSSLVDERVWLGIYAWLALEDTDGSAGGLRVLPGSHRFGNLQRTLNVPWQLAQFADVLERESVPLDVAAGSVVLFDAATVHSSWPNTGSEVRLAANSFATSADAPLLHFFADETTTPGMVEAYQIDVSFFLDADIMERPGRPYRYLGEWPQHRIACSVTEFERMCATAKAEAR